MAEVSEKNFLRFLDALSKIGPIEFIGCATLMGVPCFEDLERKVPRKTEDLMSDVLDKYLEMDRASRKKIVHILEKSKVRK